MHIDTAGSRGRAMSDQQGTRGTSGSFDTTQALERQRSEFERFSALADGMGADIRVVTARIVGRADSRTVALFFQHDEFSDVLFAYRCCPPGTEPHKPLWLAEELATGALRRIMRSGQSLADIDGVVWLRVRGSVLVAELEA